MRTGDYKHNKLNTIYSVPVNYQNANFVKNILSKRTIKLAKLNAIIAVYLIIQLNGKVREVTSRWKMKTKSFQNNSINKKLVQN